MVKLRCANCKAIDSMTKSYGKVYPCKFHENSDIECRGMTKMKCNLCDCKHSEEYFV